MKQYYLVEGGLQFAILRLRLWHGLLLEYVQASSYIDMRHATCVVYA